MLKVKDVSELEQYRAQAKEKWGGTEEYVEYEQKRESGHDFGKAAQQLMLLFAELSTQRHLPPADKAVQEKIGALKNFITDNYYTCTTEFFRGLGRMYVDDERFKRNIDRAGGEGTAEFVRRAIEIYCAQGWACGKRVRRPVRVGEGRGDECG